MWRLQERMVLFRGMRSQRLAAAQARVPGTRLGLDGGCPQRRPAYCNHALLRRLRQGARRRRTCTPRVCPVWRRALLLPRVPKEGVERRPQARVLPTSGDGEMKNTSSAGLCHAMPPKTIPHPLALSLRTHWWPRRPAIRSNGIWGQGPGTNGRGGVMYGVHVAQAKRAATGPRLSPGERPQGKNGSENRKEREREKFTRTSKEKKKTEKKTEEKTTVS